MAKARAKNKAKSGSKTKAKKVAPKKVAQAKKPAPRKVAKAKKPAPKKIVKAKKPAPKKVVKAKKPAPKKVVKANQPARAVVRPPPATPVSPRVVAPAVGRALAQAEVEGLISRLPPPVQPVVKTLRRLVLEAAPEASERLDDGSPAYFANGVFARIVPSEREVLVKFLRGAALPSAFELKGEGEARTLTLTAISELKENVLRKLVREAVMLNLSSPPVPVQA